MARVLDVLFYLSGPIRTPRRNVALAGLLALVAGILNSVGFVAVAVYTSHMTGITAGIADALVLGNLAFVIAGVVAITGFIAGAMCCAWIFNWGRRRRLQGKFANVVVVEASLILLFGLLAEQLTWVHRNLVFVAILGLTMGLQNALITKISDAQIRTTHVTGMVTDIGIELGKLSYLHRSSDLDPVVGNPHKLGMLALLVGLFFVGGVIGALGYLEVGFPALVPPALGLLVVGIPPVITDLRAARVGRAT